MRRHPVAGARWGGRSGPRWLTAWALVALLLPSLCLPARGQEEASVATEAGEEISVGSDVGREDLRTIEEILEAEAEDLAGQGYGYDPGDRRDPFRSLLEPRGRRPDGTEGCEEIACLFIDEIDITGVFITGAGPIAQVFSTQVGRSFLLREGDELADGDLLRISAGSVVFKQYLDDPRNLKPFQEVVKELNP